MEISVCPVCGEIEDCPHCLVEWYGWPGERIRGGLSDLIARMKEVTGRLLIECCMARSAPRHAALREAYEAGRAALDDQELPPVDMLDELSPSATDFVIACLRSAPAVAAMVREETVKKGSSGSEWVSLWAQDPSAVRMYLLDVLASLEVQLDQFYFERGETPPSGGASL